jgi:ubiquinone/menaquinone biosynthesis C-methylase UbiE
MYSSQETTMAHRFNPSQIYKLENPERRKILPPEEILSRLGLSEGDVMFDIGAGTGYFSIPASRIVGDEGGVLAVDSSRTMIRDLRARVKKSGARNIKIIRSLDYDFKTGEVLSDFILLSTVLHEVDDKIRFCRNAQNAMKPGSRLAVIEWSKRPMEMGPPMEARIEPAEVTGVLNELRFADIGLIEYNDYFYFVTARKRAVH